MIKKEVYGDEVRENIWKERGKGNLRILRNRVNGSCRVLMRQDSTLKVIVNHQIDPKLHLVKNAGLMTRWLISADDYADRDASDPIQLFIFKFKEDNDGSLFVGAHTLGRKLNAEVLDLPLDITDDEETYLEEYKNSDLYSESMTTSVSSNAGDAKPMVATPSFDAVQAEASATTSDGVLKAPTHTFGSAGGSMTFGSKTDKTAVPSFGSKFGAGSTFSNVKGFNVNADASSSNITTSTWGSTSSTSSSVKPVTSFGASTFSAAVT